MTAETLPNTDVLVAPFQFYDVVFILTVTWILQLQLKLWLAFSTAVCASQFVLLLSVSFFFCLSVRQSVSQSVSLSVCLSVIL